MTRDDIVKVLELRVAHWAIGDAESTSAAFAENAVLDSPITGVSKGRRAIRLAHENLFEALGPMALALDELLVDGERVVVSFTARGNHSGVLFGLPATGKPFTVNGVMVATFEGSDIAFEKRVYDFTGLLVRLGVLKATPGPETT
jgi:predicted ester cyclase